VRGKGWAAGVVAGFGDGGMPWLVQCSRPGGLRRRSVRRVGAGVEMIHSRQYRGLQSGAGLSGRDGRKMMAGNKVAAEARPACVLRQRHSRRRCLC
jgi:hypothetical protein